MDATSTKTAPGRRSRLRGRLAEIAIAGLLVYVGGVDHAAAYIDPGSGGAIITGILGFFAAVAYTTRKYWYRLKGVFTGKGGDRQDKPPPR
jgi:hypothetical protein